MRLVLQSGVIHCIWWKERLPCSRQLFSPRTYQLKTVQSNTHRQKQPRNSRIRKLLITRHPSTNTMWQLRTILAFVLGIASTGISAVPCSNGGHVSTRCHDLQNYFVAHARRLEARMSSGQSSSGGAGGSDERGTGGKADKPWKTRQRKGNSKTSTPRATQLDDFMKSPRPALPLPTMHSSTAVPFRPASTSPLASQPPTSSSPTSVPKPVIRSSRRDNKRARAAAELEAYIKSSRETSEKMWLASQRRAGLLSQPQATSAPHVPQSSRPMQTRKSEASSSRSPLASQSTRPPVPTQAGAPAIRSPSAPTPQPRRTLSSPPPASPGPAGSPSNLLPFPSLSPSRDDGTLESAYRQFYPGRLA